jgi:hypothetical protein
MRVLLGLFPNLGEEKPDRADFLLDDSRSSPEFSAAVRRPHGNLRISPYALLFPLYWRLSLDYEELLRWRMRLASLVSSLLFGLS